MKRLSPFLFLWFSAFASDGYSDERLINGTPADPKDWPSSVYASMGGGRCSATVVGERTLLMAAHCVSNGGKASFSVGPNQYSSTCSLCPQYSSNNTADWALCLIDKPVIGTQYEQVNTDPNRVSTGKEILLTGYGCINTGGGGGNDGIYRIGNSKVTKTPSGSSNDIISKSGAALCYGDSGGPAFIVDATTKDRWIVGVNSRGDISTTSYLSSVSTTTAQTFLKDWSQKNNQLICGIHSTAKGCRTSNCDPKPSAYAGIDRTISQGTSTILGGMPFPGQIYQWTPTTGLDKPTSASPVATPQVSTTYKIVATNECGSAEDSVFVGVGSDETLFVD